MSLTAYANTDYNSWITSDDANTYFSARLYSNEWTNADTATRETALLQAFRELNRLNLMIDLEEDESPLEQLKAAQCEQALHLLQNDPTAPGIASVSISGGMSVKLGGDTEKEPEPYSPQALAILSEYVQFPAVRIKR